MNWTETPDDEPPAKPSWDPDADRDPMSRLLDFAKQMMTQPAPLVDP